LIKGDVKWSDFGYVEAPPGSIYVCGVPHNYDVAGNYNYIKLKKKLSASK